MKHLIKFKRLINLSTITFFMILFGSCSFDEAKPIVNGETISQRTDCTSVAEAVKVKVSERDHIPLEEILTSNYYGMTIDGYCEYRLTTMYNGPRVYFVTAIIGDDIEGL